jgi:catechol-2,3-dioxygenase
MNMKVNGILESALYFDDIEEAASFYKNLFDFETLIQNERLIALTIADKQVLLLFKKESSLSPITLPGGGIIPPHDGSGPVHIAFSISSDSYDDWLTRLANHHIETESTVEFNEGRSIYFRDPGNHLVELATPGIWKGLD